MDLFYREEGEGFPIVILHGLFGMSDNWMTVAKKLSDQYHTIVVDLRNHGSSPRSDTWNYDVMADDLDELVQKLSVKKFHLIGHSMGGKVAMEYVQKYPEKVEKLIVVDIAPKYYPVHHQHIIDALYKIDLKALNSRQEAEEILKTELDDWGTRQFLLKNLGRNGDGFYWKFNLDVISKKIENVGRTTSPNIVDTPALFIKGSKSEYIRTGDSKPIRDQFKNSAIVAIKDSGHWVHAEKMDEFIETVRKFLEYNPT